MTIEKSQTMLSRRSALLASSAGAAAALGMTLLAPHALAQDATPVAGSDQALVHDQETSLGMVR
jgi:hypothetical protein